MGDWDWRAKSRLRKPKRGKESQGDHGRREQTTVAAFRPWRGLSVRVPWALAETNLGIDAPGGKRGVGVSAAPPLARHRRNPGLRRARTSSRLRGWMRRQTSRGSPPTSEFRRSDGTSCSARTPRNPSAAPPSRASRPGTSSSDASKTSAWWVHPPPSPEPRPIASRSAQKAPSLWSIPKASGITPAHPTGAGTHHTGTPGGRRSGRGIPPLSAGQGARLRSTRQARCFVSSSRDQNRPGELP